MARRAGRRLLLDGFFGLLAGLLGALLHGMADVFDRLAGAVSNVLAQLLERVSGLLGAGLGIVANSLGGALEEVVLVFGLGLLCAVRCGRTQTYGDDSEDEDAIHGHLEV